MPSSNVFVSRHSGSCDVAIEQLNDDSDEPPNELVQIKQHQRSLIDGPNKRSIKQTISTDSKLIDRDSEDESDEENTPPSSNQSDNQLIDSTDAGSSSSDDEDRLSPMFSPALPSSQSNNQSSGKYLNLNLLQPVANQTIKQSISAATGYELPAGYDPSAPVDELPEAGVPVSYVNPMLEARTCSTGSGVFALEFIPKGTLLIVWTGRIMTAEQTMTLMDTPDKHYILQIGDGFYQTPLQPNREPADWTNHSCSPNAGFGAQSPVCLSAMRDIQIGEEVTFDYGMCETDERLWEPMECGCGASQCRKLITANDWKMHPELWSRYEGYFSPHVQRKIDALKKQIEQLEQQEQEQQQQGPQKQMNLKDLVDDQKTTWFDRLLWSMGLVRANAIKA